MLDAISLNSAPNANSLQTQKQGNIKSYQESGKYTEKLNFSYESDKVSLGYSSESVLTYNSSMSLVGEVPDQFELLRGLVLDVFKEQGIDYNLVAEGVEVDVESITQEEAQELIADDGYFGVEQTSERIFQFAVGIAGGDVSRLDAIREGVEKGFQEALDAFGGWLPEISYDTLDAVMTKLDGWAENQGSS